MDNLGAHRPRNVDWKRAAALLYGDWGTSKAYVIGLAFLTAGFASFQIILAVCALTAVVGYVYTIVCRHFPDGGGVYSAARSQSRLLAVIGALLLVADLVVTAATSGWAAMAYFGVPKQYIATATIGVILLIGAMNFFGPKHSGSLAMFLAVPTVVVVVMIIVFAVPHLTVTHLEQSHDSLKVNWVHFCGVILALSGVEAIANLTGVMRLDPESTMETPVVARTARKAIWVVAVEVVLGTVLLGWAMLSLSPELKMEMDDRWEDMLRFLAEQYGTMQFGPSFGHYFGLAVGIIVAFLLLSAVNTAVVALIGLMYLLARDGEMPRPFAKLNSHGVPWLPLLIAVALPIAVVAVANDLASLTDLYAIGVVGAISVNIGSCVFNKEFTVGLFNRGLMFVTFLVLVAVEVTLAKTKPEALFFVVCILGVGLGLRGWSQRRAGLRTVTVTEDIAAAVSPESAPPFRLNLVQNQTILVAARGLTPVLGFALEEARLRRGSIYVLYVKELAVAFPGPLSEKVRPRWQEDEQAAEIMATMLEQGRQNDVTVIPLYVVSENPAATILDLSATLGIDILMLGTPHRRTLVTLLKGSVVTEVANNLPENIRLIIYG